MQGEPDWMIETALKRKREGLARKWEDREARMEKIRKREKEMEERAAKAGRGGKRVRVDDLGKREVDEEEEFLIRDWNGDGEDDSLSMLSKETRERLEKVGMGMARRGGEEEEEGEVGDEIKVRLGFAGCVAGSGDG